MDLHDKAVLVTGGATGIGAAAAGVIAELGGHPVLLGPERGPLLETAEKLGAVAVVGDASRAPDVQQAIGLARSTHGSLDGLVCCAGGGGMGRLGDLDDEAWAAGLNLSLGTAVVSTRECLPELVARRGAIVIVSSFGAVQAPGSSAGYVTAKAALLGLTRSLATDYGPEVRVNAVCPTLTRTAMADSAMDGLAQRFGIDREAAYARVTAKVPLQRPAEPVEVGRVIGFLLSDWASYLTSSTILVDGGQAGSVRTQ